MQSVTPDGRLTEYRCYTNYVIFSRLVREAYALSLLARPETGISTRLRADASRYGLHDSARL